MNLTCNADGFVTTKVWMKDGKPLVAGDRFSFHDGNRVLSISPVDRRDTGEFLCHVSNDFSLETAKCRLKVYCKCFELYYNMFFFNSYIHFLLIIHFEYYVTIA